MTRERLNRSECKALTYHTETSLLSLCSLFHIRTQTRRTKHFSISNSKNFASATLRLCDAAGEPRPIWCKNTALFLISHSLFASMNFRVGFNFYGSQKKNNNKKTAPSFQTTESQDALPRYDSQAGFCWFALGCLGLDSVLLRHLWDLPFKKADIQSRL